jgi:hypothetical protein
MPATAAQHDDRQRPRRQGVHEDRERRATGLHRRMSHGDCSAAAASMPSGCSSTWTPRRLELPRRGAGGPVVVVNENRRDWRVSSSGEMGYGGGGVEIGPTRTFESLTTHLDGTAVHRRGGCTVSDCSRGSTNPPASSLSPLRRRALPRCCSLCGSLSARPVAAPVGTHATARGPLFSHVLSKQDGLGRYTYSKATERFDTSDAG